MRNLADSTSLQSSGSPSPWWVSWPAYLTSLLKLSRSQDTDKGSRSAKRCGALGRQASEIRMEFCNLLTLGTWWCGILEAVCQWRSRTGSADDHRRQEWGRPWPGRHDAWMRKWHTWKLKTFRECETHLKRVSCFFSVTWNSVPAPHRFL